MTKEDILGTRVSTISISEMIKMLSAHIENGRGSKTVFCANANVIVAVLKDRYFFDALSSADILLPDGAGVLLASKIFKGRIKNRISGADIFQRFSEYADRRGNISYFFLGSTPAVLEKINENMRKQFPNIKVAGCYSPPFAEVFSEAEDKKIIEAVNSKRPDVLWIGMTAPKQEEWIYDNKSKLDVKLIGAIGAVFDFFAGTTKRAPEWMQRGGLEWFFRLMQEPRRLWKRAIIQNFRFILYLMLACLKLKKF